MFGLIQGGVSGLIGASVLAVAAVGFTLQFSVTRYFNFGYGEWITTGAYIAWGLNGPLHLNIWASMLVSGGAVAILSILLNRSVFLPFVKKRSNPIFILIVTFAVGSLLNEIIILIWGTSFREYQQPAPHNYKFSSIQLSSQQLAFLGIAVSLMLTTQFILRRTKLGRSMRAVADNRDLAAVCGLRTTRIIDETWALTGFMAGIAGVILAIQTHAFGTGIGDSYVYLIFPAVIIGGIGNVYGAVIGALIIGLFAGIGPTLVSSAISPVLVFAALVAVILIRPQGLIGGKTRVTT